MAWIKENYDRFLLALFALALLACALWLMNNARGFSETFSELQNQPPRSTQSQQAMDPIRFQEVMQKVKTPDLWRPVEAEGRRVPLFTSIPFIANPIMGTDGTTKEELVDPETSSTALHPPIPNKWFLDNNLRDSLLSQSALADDPDGDGFSNLDEFNGKTNPTDKTSHPAYTTKLFLQQFIQRPFRFRFEARNGQVAQINPLDIADAGSQFLRVGQSVQGTKFKVVDLKIQDTMDGNLRRDTSVVTLENVETKERIELPKEKDVDSPDSYARMAYVWGEGRRFDIKKNQEFSIKPEENVKYRLVDVSREGATILRLTDNATLKMPPLPAPGAVGR